MEILLAFGIGLLVGGLLWGFAMALVFYKKGYNDRKKSEYYKLYGGRDQACSKD